MFMNFKNIAGCQKVSTNLKIDPRFQNMFMKLKIVHVFSEKVYEFELFFLDLKNMNLKNVPKFFEKP